MAVLAVRAIGAIAFSVIYLHSTHALAASKEIGPEDKGGPNVIERNVMWGCGDHGIQSAADVIIRNNIVLGSAGHLA